MGALTNLLTRNHGELARLVLPISIATGFVWTLGSSSGKPLLDDPYRWRTGKEAEGEAAGAPAKTLLTLRR